MKRQPATTTLGDLQRSNGWVWAYCEGQGCGHRVALAIAPFAIRWGLDASSDLMRERLRCAKCGHLGVSLRPPSWIDSVVGQQPFPAG